jgi:hypothetical protein
VNFIPKEADGFKSENEQITKAIKGVNERTKAKGIWVNRPGWRQENYRRGVMKIRFKIRN